MYITEENGGELVSYIGIKLQKYDIPQYILMSIQIDIYNTENHIGNIIEFKYLAKGSNFKVVLGDDEMNTFTEAMEAVAAWIRLTMEIDKLPKAEAG